MFRAMVELGVKKRRGGGSEAASRVGSRRQSQTPFFVQRQSRHNFMVYTTGCKKSWDDFKLVSPLADQTILYFQENNLQVVSTKCYK